MASVFLSYSHQDVALAEDLDEALCAIGNEVWRDKSKLHAGDRWPKALGEAIAGCDIVVVLWSVAAAKSDFVELEWTTALALKRQIVPWLLDTAQLPPSLKSLHALSGGATAEVARKVNAAARSSSPTEARLRQAVVDSLASIPAQQPMQVAEAARLAFEQQGWVVQGPVYQAAGNIVINYGNTTQRQWLERWQVWASLVVALLTVATLIQQLRPHGPPRPSEPGPTIGSPRGSAMISGVVVDDGNTPISGAIVSLYGTAKFTRTNNGGYFSLEVDPQRSQNVRLKIEKTGYKKRDETYPAGGELVTITIEKE